ncbi:MAG: putative minor capsid protein [Oscillospiraceae bacterium]
MKPIPKRLLIHSAVLYEVAENSWQETEKKELAKLSRVRIEPSSKMIISSNNRSVTLSATLFYDCRNSLPTIEFKPGYLVEFEGNTYRVEQVEVFYDQQKLHHLEVGLCL